MCRISKFSPSDFKFCDISSFLKKWSPCVYVTFRRYNCSATALFKYEHDDVITAIANDTQ